MPSQKTSQLRSATRNLTRTVDEEGMSASERFLRAAERAFDAEDSQRLAAQEVLNRLRFSDKE